MESLRFTFEQNPLQIIGEAVLYNTYSVALLIENRSNLKLFELYFYQKFTIWSFSKSCIPKVSIVNFFIRWKFYLCLCSDFFNDDFFLNKIWNLQLLNTQKCRNCFEIAISNQNRRGYDSKGDTVELTIKQRNCSNIFWTIDDIHVTDSQNDVRNQKL